ncbi:gliding motility-associated-like protein [Cecembia rubra]|uniref:Gliding motility-associated-like protein n=2 Tax=Cecembia rubra TaxID=1485585 RepID=A0A2P8DX02_9BACT|nr:gliding motility-associated-like protein [Cecembia rubra]
MITKLKLFEWVIFFQKYFLMFLFSVISFSSYSQLGFPYCETFDGGNVQSNTAFGGTARLLDGVIRLTDAGVDQNGYVYIDIPFPSAYGLKASFEYYIYGGSGADGLSFFLFDAETPNFTPGGFGGSLGYAQRNNQSGLSRGYLGIGFDSFGNFGNSSEGKTGGFFGVGTGLVPNTVVVRGPGNGLTGYPFVVGRRTMESGNDGMRPDNQFTISSGGLNTTRVTDPNVPGYRKVFIELEPNPLDGGYFLTVRMLVTFSPGQAQMLTIFDRPYYFEAPKNLKVGFAASTGGFTNIHEIDNLTVEVFDLDGLEEPLAKNIDDKASCASQENTFEITLNEVELFNENSEIACLQFYPSLEAIEEEDSDVCSRAKCRPENRVLELPQGVFRAADVGGKFTFFPNPDFIDDTVKVYFTVTDNYGKTSKGKYISLLIQESPDPVSLVAEGMLSNVDQVRKCEGEGVLLRADGDEDYFAYEWYLNDQLLPNSNVPEWMGVAPGRYQVIAYNSKNCPAASAYFEIINPPFPVIEIEDRIVGCELGVGLDIRDYIPNYDPSIYDYELESPLGIFFGNEEMSDVQISGKYLLRVKHKDLECWSSAIPFELIISTIPLIPDFDYGVDSTGVKSEEEGGIFIDDPIRFEDLSKGNAVSWEWDFGDGAKSTEQNPVHTFGRKGVFQVKLTIANSLGCTESIIIELPLKLSYRVMIPTGFTPTLQENNFFRPKTKGIIAMEIYIFNLWGNLVFKSEGVSTLGWDGKINGELAPAGNYAYRIKMSSIEGEVIEESGRLTLIR